VPEGRPGRSCPRHRASRLHRLHGRSVRRRPPSTASTALSLSPTCFCSASHSE
jgi:hypothetical protein